MEMPPVFQKPILKRESQVTSMPNLISNLFGGSFFFTRNAYKYSLRFTNSVYHFKANQKNNFLKRILPPPFFFSLNTKVPKPQVNKEMHLVLKPSY